MRLYTYFTTQRPAPFFQPSFFPQFQSVTAVPAIGPLPPKLSDILRPPPHPLPLRPCCFSGFEAARSGDEAASKSPHIYHTITTTTNHYHHHHHNITTSRQSHNHHLAFASPLSSLSRCNTLQCHAFLSRKCHSSFTINKSASPPSLAGHLVECDALLLRCLA